MWMTRKEVEPVQRLAKGSRDIASKRLTNTIWCDVTILDEMIFLRLLRMKLDSYQI